MNEGKPVRNLIQELLQFKLSLKQKNKANSLHDFGKV
jgi:hypothetical protein